MSTPEWYTELTQDVPTDPPSPSATGPERLTDADVAAFEHRVGAPTTPDPAGAPQLPGAGRSPVGPPPGPPGHRHPRSPRWSWALAGLALATVSAGSLWWALQESEVPSVAPPVSSGPTPTQPTPTTTGGPSPSRSPSATPPPGTPTAWDPRIEPLIPQVEKLRGLDFQHPVTVRFLAEKKFVASLAAQQEEITAEDRETIRSAEGMYRATALLPPGIDLLETVSSLRDQGTLAYYSWKTKEVTVRGQELTPQVTATVVHELTHVLQDQHFDLATRQEAYQQAGEKARTASPAEADNGSESTVFSAIVEGDAERIKEAWISELDADDQAAAREQPATDPYQGLPSVITASFAMPYVMGPQLVDRAADTNGNAGVDELLRDPPTYENVLFEPLLFGTEEAEVTDVPSPALAAGEKQIWRGGMGQTAVFQMLGERLELPRSLLAADTWDGDAAVAFTRDGTTCVRVAIATRDSQDDTLLQALRAWEAAGPDGFASVGRSGELVTLESCDPGKAAPAGNDAGIEGMQLLALRSQVASSMLDAGRSPEFARCYGTGTATRLTIPQLTSKTISPEVTTVLQDLVRECGLS